MVSEGNSPVRVKREAVMVSEKQAYVNRYLRALWIMIHLLGQFVGVLTGLAFGLPDFWLRPAEGLLAMGMVLVLVVVVAMIDKLRAG